jgi:hypothetical protein
LDAALAAAFSKTIAEAVGRPLKLLQVPEKKSVFDNVKVCNRSKHLFLCLAMTV